jgi:hypothetical protein
MSEVDFLKSVPGVFAKESAPEMADEEFHSIKDLIYDYCGLSRTTTSS